MIELVVDALFDARLGPVVALAMIVAPVGDLMIVAPRALVGAATIGALVGAATMGELLANVLAG